MEPLKTDTLRDEQNCPSYRGVRLIEVIFNRNRPSLGHLKVSVLERCPSYRMSVLRGFTVYGIFPWYTPTLFERREMLPPGNVYRWAFMVQTLKTTVEVRMLTILP